MRHTHRRATLFSFACMLGLLALELSWTHEAECRAELLAKQNEKVSLERASLLDEANELTCQRDQAIDELEAFRAERLRQAAASLVGETKPVAARVVELPEDGENLHTILFLQKDWKTRPNEMKAERLFASEPWCMDLRARTHWHVWTIDQPEAKPYWKFVTKTPCLIIQDCKEHGGRILYNEPNPDLAKHPKGLLHQINVTRKRQKHGTVSPYNGPCPDGVCPDDQKKSNAGPDGPPPTDEVKVDAAPDAPDAKHEGIPAGIAIAIALSIGAAGFVGLTLATKTKNVRKAMRGQ